VKERADRTCEHCGKQCRRPEEAFDGQLRTLACAHLDHDPENPYARLAALCTPFRLSYDNWLRRRPFQRETLF
jgi:hypothetical protein